MKRQLRSTSLRQRQLEEEEPQTKSTEEVMPVPVAKKGRKRAMGSKKAVKPIADPVAEEAPVELVQLDSNNNLNGTLDNSVNNERQEEDQKDEEEEVIIMSLDDDEDAQAGFSDNDSSQSIQMDAIISEDSTSQSSNTAQSSKKSKKEYKCEICDKQFQGLNDLRKHLRIHSDERPYPCSQCDKKFRQAGCLKNHVASQHGTDEEFVCTFCNKAFPIKERLRLHLRVHTGYKPYKCDMCSKEFARGGQVREFKFS